MWYIYIIIGKNLFKTTFSFLANGWILEYSFHFDDLIVLWQPIMYFSNLSMMETHWFCGIKTHRMKFVSVGTILFLSTVKEDQTRNVPRHKIEFDSVRVNWKLKFRNIGIYRKVIYSYKQHIFIKNFQITFFQQNTKN